MESAAATPLPFGNNHSVALGTASSFDATSVAQMAAAQANATTTTTMATAMLQEPPVETWCFDLLLFYRSIGEDDPQAKNVLAQLEEYVKFSFATNGVITCCLAVFGLLGNMALLLQLYGKSNYFSRRLANHLSVLAFWDIALLLCCLCSYGIMCIFYGILPFFGLTAYLLYLFQPFASFCVTGTIWQVLAITVERYKAVTRPLSSRKGQLSLRAICGTIAFGAFALNFLVVPFERKLVDCYEFTHSGSYSIRTMIVQKELANNQYYAILAHLLPDVLFRAPTPILVIAILTVKTLQIASAQRTVGHQQIVRHRSLGRNSSVHLMLTLLSVKFVLCNTLYLFNTILMEVMGYGGKTSSHQTELEMEQYIRSLYLTDFSNCLLAIHSATNWLIFYKWKWISCTNQKRESGKLKGSFAYSTSNPEVLKSALLDPHSAHVVLKRFRERREHICADILGTLCANSTAIGNAMGGGREVCHEGTAEQPLGRHTLLLENVELKKRVLELADIIETVLYPLAQDYHNLEQSIVEWTNLCRQIGYNHFRLNSLVSAEQWKVARTLLVLSLGKQCPAGTSAARWQPQCARVHQAVLTNLQKTFIRTFNIALREMKNGACCALVDHSQRQLLDTANGQTIACRGTPGRLVHRIARQCSPPCARMAKSMMLPRHASSSHDSFSLIFPSDGRECDEEATADEERRGAEEQQLLRRGTAPESTLARAKTSRERLRNGGRDSMDADAATTCLLLEQRQHSDGGLLLEQMLQHRQHSATTECQ